MGNTLAQLGSALALGVALAGAPNTASAQVSEATRAKVMELQKDPAFKLKGSAKKCMSGELVDPLCESLIKGQVDGFQSNQELLALQAEKSRLDAEKSRLDAEKSRLDAEKSRLDAEKSRLDVAHKLKPNTGSLVYLLEGINIALFGLEKGDFEQTIQNGTMTDEVRKYLSTIIQKTNKRESISKQDIQTFVSLYEKNWGILQEEIKKNPGLQSILDMNGTITRISIIYATIKPKIEAKIG